MIILMKLNMFTFTADGFKICMIPFHFYNNEINPRRTPNYLMTEQRLPFTWERVADPFLREAVNTRETTGL